MRSSKSSGCIYRMNWISLRKWCSVGGPNVVKRFTTTMGSSPYLKTMNCLPKEEPKKVKTHIRQKVKTGNKPKRIIFPADLPREDQILNPEGIEEDRYEKIGEDITEILAYQPGNIFVKRIIRPRRSEEHTSELQSRGHLVCRL